MHFIYTVVVLVSAQSKLRWKMCNLIDPSVTFTEIFLKVFVTHNMQLMQQI